ncbi:MAG: flagellar motor switch protein FliN [Chloroflexi bacterium]|nr:flagellar motor switch protein FliN [Chloroflexota bacterium]
MSGELDQEMLDKLMAEAGMVDDTPPLVGSVQSATQPTPAPVVQPAPAPMEDASKVAVHQAHFAPLPATGPASETTRGMEFLMEVSLDITVELGRTRMPLRDILALNHGAVIELDKVAGEPVDVLVNGTLIAKGEVVVVDEKFGVRVTEIVSPAKRVASLGGN